MESLNRVKAAKNELNTARQEKISEESKQFAVALERAKRVNKPFYTIVRAHEDISFQLDEQINAGLITETQRNERITFVRNFMREARKVFPDMPLDS